MTTRRAERSRAPRRDVRLRDLDVRALIPLWVALALFMAWWVRFIRSRHGVGVDAHAYWLTAHHSHLYGLAPTVRDAYLYTPAFAQVIRPLALFPWPVFFAIWIVAETAVFAWLLKPLGWGWGVPALLLCGFEIAAGNVFSFIAAVAVVGLRRPAAWSLPLLTKITPGLGPLWFAARREWRQLATSIWVTLVIAGVSLAIAPRAWSDWFHFLRSNTGAHPILWIHIVAGAVLCVVAARLDRRWLLVPALVLACPVLDGWLPYTVFAAVPRLLEADRAARSNPEVVVS